MRILLVAATFFEVKNFTKHPVENGKPQKVEINSNHSIDIIITGVGAVPTAFFVTRFAADYDFVLNIGIAGSYCKSINLGQVVVVAQDCFGDYGIDDNGNFISLMQAGLLDQACLIKADIMTNSWIERINCITKYKKVIGLTLGTASGSTTAIDRVKSTWNPDIETMESAAVFYACLILNKPFLCLRAISNMVEPRNKQNWRIQDAISNLHHEVLNIINELSVTNL